MVIFYYQITFDRLLRDDNNQLGMLYDMAYSSQQPIFSSFFFRAALSWKKKSPFAENISLLPPGAHEIKIIVRDRQDNQAVALIPIQKLADGKGFSSERNSNPVAQRSRILPKADFSTYVNRDDVVVKIKDFPGRRPGSN